MPSKIALFYNHSSRYLGVDVTLSVMPMQDWDTESMGISAENPGRHVVLPPPEWDRAAGGKSWPEGTRQKGQPCTTGYAGCKAGICSLQFPTSWQVGNQLTHVFSGLCTYKQFPRNPGEWQGQYKGKISHPERLLSQRKNQAEATFLYSCQKSILTFLQNILTRYFAKPVRLSLPEKVSLNWQSAQYYLLYSQ